MGPVLEKAALVQAYDPQQLFAFSFLFRNVGGVLLSPRFLMLWCRRRSLELRQNLLERCVPSRLLLQDLQGESFFHTGSFERPIGLKQQVLGHSRLGAGQTDGLRQAPPSEVCWQLGSQQPLPVVEIGQTDAIAVLAGFQPCQDHLFLDPRMTFQPPSDTQQGFGRIRYASFRRSGASAEPCGEAIDVHGLSVET